jgi:hypothetical protein
VFSLAVVIPAGLYCKVYSGPAANWVHNSLSGVLYELFWCLLVSILFERIKPWTIAVSVLIATCLLEFMQLWHPPFLELVRSTFVGRTLLGTSFTWLDFPHYLAGCAIGWLWTRGTASRLSPGRSPAAGQPRWWADE